MEIRKAVLKDLKAIDEIYLDGVIDEVRLQSPERTRKDIFREMDQHKKDRLNGFRKGMKSKFEKWLVSVEGSQIVGFGQATINQNNKSKGEFEKLYLLKQHRHKGIGIKISKKLLEWAKHRKVKTISAGIFIKNKPSIKLTEKLGFKPTAIRMLKKL